VVREPDSQNDIWWADGNNGSPNFEMDDRTFKLNRERAVDYLNMLDRLYVFDGYAGWEEEVTRLPPKIEGAKYFRLTLLLFWERDKFSWLIIFN
jgi:ATP-dependent phosphoenolpyruvate carboxykinase